MKKVISLMVVVLLAAACSGLNSAVKKGEIAPVFTDTKVDGKYLWVRGFGAVNPAHSSVSQRKIMSREAAVAHGYQRAAEYIYGNGVKANIRIKDAVSQDSVIETAVNGLVKAMEIYETEYLSDEGCSVIMRLDLNKLKKAGVTLEETK
ncbi:hypothetical protein Dip518_000720 [Parelusimicrobium proximum]|uniref:hypothetical protein n=1 Tax=Parelusimicrobium proximum TaxID=3228953 RepID=UPI003D171AA1